MKGNYNWSIALALAICLLLQVRLPAQTPQELSQGSLQQQFDHLVNESSRYQHYKVVPQTWLNTFWSHVQDTIREQRGQLREQEVTMNVQRENVKRLETEKETLNGKIDTLQKEKDSLTFLGMTIDKAAYHVLVWTIIAALVVGLLFFLGRFRYANAVTRQTRKDKEELQEKVDHLRRRMLEKEQELRRQLQDEINKRLS